MKTLLRCTVVAALGAAALADAQAAGEVRVNFVGADRYIDVGFDPADRRQALDAVERAFAGWGTKHLADGQALEIEVLDIDLAGEERPGQRGDTRVMAGGADWPRMKLRWTLRAGERVLGAGEEHLSDMNYLDRRTSVRAGEPYFYDRRMVETWLTTRVLPLSGGSN